MQEKHLRYKNITKPHHMVTPTNQSVVQSERPFYRHEEHWTAGATAPGKTCSEINRAFDLSVIMRTTLVSKHALRAAHILKNTPNTLPALPKTHTLRTCSKESKEINKGEKATPPLLREFYYSALLGFSHPSLPTILCARNKAADYEAQSTETLLTCQSNGNLHTHKHTLNVRYSVIHPVSYRHYDINTVSPTNMISDRWKGFKWQHPSSKYYFFLFSLLPKEMNQHWFTFTANFDFTFWVLHFIMVSMVMQ